jgi:hypothetical protein
MAKHQEHVHPSGPSALPTQGSLSSSFSGRSSQRTTTRQKTEASYTSISSATVRSQSKLSARSSVTLGAIPASTPPAPSPSASHKSTPQMSLNPRGKQRELLPKDTTTDIPQSRPLSLKAQGKQRKIVSNLPPSTTRSLSSTNSSPTPSPVILPSPRKKIKRVIPESDDDVSRSSKNSPSSRPPKKMAKMSNEEPSKPE